MEFVVSYPNIDRLLKYCVYAFSEKL